MPEIVIYSSARCPYCTMAKHLLVQKGVSYKEIRVDRDSASRDEMMKRSRRYTVPQVFIGDRHIGGFDDLYALDRAGGLDPLLGCS